MNTISEQTFRAVTQCYAKGIEKYIPTFEDFIKKTLFLDSTDIFHKSVSLRLNATEKIRNARYFGGKLDLETTWKEISESIKLLPVEWIVSSVGSQGFLSIPLSKHEDADGNFEFIRLHIWDKSLDVHVNKEISEKLSTHSHLFDGESWIICGQIINDRFNVEVKEITTPFSLFSIQYNNTLNEVNKHTSLAYNTNQFVEVRQLSHEIYMQGGSYKIQAGDFHRSASNELDDICATFFVFTANKNFSGKSFVVGPSSITSSEINRKKMIDPTELINRINNKLKSCEY